MKRKVLLIVTIIGLLSSCATVNKLLGRKDKLADCQSKVDSLQNALDNKKVENTELASNNEALTKLARTYIKNIDSLATECAKAKDQNAKLNALNEELVTKQAVLSQDNATEAKKIMAELQTTREDLQKREDKLDDLEKDLEKERTRLGKLSSDLAQKEKQVRELESILRAKDSAANALKARLSLALKGFEGNGLTINQRDGKIYVSLEEQLLFEIGKSEVNPKGTEALKKLAGVLEKNADINILVEGHTDNTGTAKLNWKLSTDRALAISAIILENDKIDGKRVTAAGRGQFSPIDDNATIQGRTKNRRCEIILSPKLDELYKIIEN